MLAQSYSLDTTTASGADPSGYAPDFSLDQFLHARPRILKTKLEVLASEIMERFQVRDQNLLRIQNDVVTLREMISDVSRLSGYGVRDHSEKNSLYQLLFGLRKEERDQDTSCWSDVVEVMRDFLAAWEAHEQARARAILLQ